MTLSLKEQAIKSKNIGVIGLGLIGGSLALKLKQEGFNVIGFDQVKIQTTEFPVHKSYENLKSCDFVFICVPLRFLTNILEEVQPYLKNSAVVTDVGSVKEPICDFVKKIMKQGCIFVGGHPMAGTEKAGFENASPDLFEGKSWVLTSKCIELENIINKTGAKLVYTTPQKHDEAVAMVSHLPLLLSIGLLKTVENIEDKDQKELAKQLASSGFEGMVRLAKGNQVLNEDLLTFNKQQLQKTYKKFLSAVDFDF